MRKIALILLTLTAAVTAVLAGKPGRKAAAARQAAAVKERLESRDFQIDVRRALPASGRAVMLNTRYWLRIRGDSVFSYLPYFGRAYSVPYGGGDGLVFNGAMTDYKAQPGKKERTRITFGVRSRDDFFRYRIEVFDTGPSYLSVMSTHRQEIGFQGELYIGAPEKSANTTGDE